LTRGFFIPGFKRDKIESPLVEGLELPEGADLVHYGSTSWLNLTLVVVN
jgi:hypothetical protein